VWEVVWEGHHHGGSSCVQFHALGRQFDMVSGHAGGGWSSTNLYHLLRLLHASFMTPLLKWLLTVDAAFMAHCSQSAVSRDLILHPIQWGRKSGGPVSALLPACAQLPKSYPISIRWQGAPSQGGGLHQDVTPCTCPRALYGDPGGF
jgi:hypothetical protein